MFSVLGIEKTDNRREIRKALRRNKNEVFEVIEDTITVEVAKGFNDNEFFNQFVDNRNLSLGDRNDFWTDDNIILTVSKVAGNHHDLSMQRLGAGTSYTVGTSWYGIAVGGDIELFLTGRKNFADFVNAAAKAFVKKVQDDLYAQVMNLDNTVPNALKGTGTLDATSKVKFDQIIEDVSTANDGAEVVIFGTKTALKALNALAEVDWRSDSQKQDVANFGRLGAYETTTLIEIPQRFGNNVDFTANQADLPRLVDSKTLLIMPAMGDKFVKFVDEGDTQIYEITEKGATMDDMERYEIQRKMGVSVQLGRYHGAWKLA